MRIEDLVLKLYCNLLEDGYDKKIFLSRSSDEVLKNIVCYTHQDILPNDFIYKAIYDIIHYFEENLDLIEGKHKRKQKDLLIYLLYDFEPNIPYRKLLEWTNNFSYYVDEILQDKIEVNSLESLLRLGYQEFTQEVGSNLIEALYKYSE